MPAQGRILCQDLDEEPLVVLGRFALSVSWP